jgi:hypothetical protein
VSGCKFSVCRALIDFATTTDGKPMPIDPGWDGAELPREQANVAVQRTRGRLTCRVLREGEEPRGGEQLAVPHWATCEHVQAAKRDAASIRDLQPSLDLDLP